MENTEEKSEVRIRFYPKDTDDTFDGTLIQEDIHSYLVVPDDNLTGSARWNKKYCDIIKLTIYVLFVMTTVGCSESKINNRKCSLNVRNGSGWSSGGSMVECDSFQMQGTRKAIVWVDGYKMNIEAEDVIYPTIR